MARAMKTAGWPALAVDLAALGQNYATDSELNAPCEGGHVVCRRRSPNWRIGGKQRRHRLSAAFAPRHRRGIRRAWSRSTRKVGPRAVSRSAICGCKRLAMTPRTLAARAKRQRAASLPHRRAHATAPGRSAAQFLLVRTGRLEGVVDVGRDSCCHFSERGESRGVLERELLAAEGSSSWHPVVEV